MPWPTQKMFDFNLFDIYSIDDIVNEYKTADNGLLSCTEDGTFTTDHILKCLMTSNISNPIKSKLNREWIENHTSLILHKLKGYEYNLKCNFRSEVYTPEVLLEQLRYRLDVEYIDGKRSILQRISEHDILPTQPMVLYVSSHSPLRLSDRVLNAFAVWVSWENAFLVLIEILAKIECLPPDRYVLRFFGKFSKVVN